MILGGRAGRRHQLEPLASPTAKQTEVRKAAWTTGGT